MNRFYHTRFGLTDEKNQGGSDSLQLKWGEKMVVRDRGRPAGSTWPPVPFLSSLGSVALLTSALKATEIQVLISKEAPSV